MNPLVFFQRCLLEYTSRFEPIFCSEQVTVSTKANLVGSDPEEFLLFNCVPSPPGHFEKISESQLCRLCDCDCSLRDTYLLWDNFSSYAYCRVSGSFVAQIRLV